MTAEPKAGAGLLWAPDPKAVEPKVPKPGPDEVVGAPNAVLEEEVPNAGLEEEEEMPNAGLEEVPKALAVMVLLLVLAEEPNMGAAGVEVDWPKAKEEEEEGSVFLGG